MNKQGHPFLDDPSKWADSISPPFFDRTSFQERIDKTIGVNREGKSIILLRWSAEVFEPFYGEKVPRYWVRRIKEAGGFRYAVAPRYVFEKRVEPEQYVPQWNATRYSARDPLTKQVIDKGDPPPEYYARFRVLAEHDEIDKDSGWPSCCYRLYAESRSICYGYFRQPNDEDLISLSAARQRMEKETFVDPYAPIPVDKLAEIERAGQVIAAEEEKQRSREIGERIADFTKRHAWRIWETDPRVLKHGRASMGDPLKAIEQFKKATQ